MSFLQSLFLVGLAAALIPVLIHLLNRPQARVVRFSMLEFVKRLQIKKSRRLRFREILLLLLRVLLVVLLAIAFARPALRGVLPHGIGGRARTSACIVLDASYSMEYNQGEQSLFDMAKERAHGVVDLLREGDEALLVLAADPPEARFDTPTHNFGLLDAEIERAVPTAGAADIAQSLQRAFRSLERSRNANREIYLITDMQRTSFDSLSEKTGGLSDESTKLFLLPVGEGERRNCAIDGAELFEPRRLGETVQIRATVANHSNLPADRLVTLTLDGERRGSSSVTIEPGRTASALFSVLLRERGIHRGEVTLDEDLLPIDDTFYFTLFQPERLDVLIVGDRNERGLFYLKNVLDPGDGSGMMRVHSADPSEIRSMRLEPYHAVFLAGVSSLDDAAIGRLEEYLIGGGGIVVVPGDGIDSGLYNRKILPRLFGQVRIGSVLEHGDGSVLVDEFDTEHPLFQIFRQGLDLAFEEVRVSRRFDLEAGGQAFSLVRTSDGRPFLVESRKGAGRALLWATGFDLTWSDLPNRPLFLPLVHETVRYLYSGGALYKASLTVGAAYTKDLSSVALGEEELVCRTPLEEVVLQPRAEGDLLSVEFEETSVPGFYEVMAGGFSEWFAVNLSTRESNLEPIHASDLKDHPGFSLFRVIPHGTKLERPVMESRYGRELWWELVWLALLVAFVEMMVAGSRRSTARSRE